MVLRLGAAEMELDCRCFSRWWTAVGDGQSMEAEIIADGDAADSRNYTVGLWSSWW
jgi:hypothetical protein